MNEVSSSEDHCSTQTEQGFTLSELTTHPVIMSLDVDYVDWDRLKRYVGQIPGTGSRWHDVTLTSFGVLIPTVVTAIGLPYTSANLPEWIITINWVVVGMSGITTILCYFFARTKNTDVRKTVSDVLQEMEVIEIHSPKTQKRIGLTRENEQ